MGGRQDLSRPRRRDLYGAPPVLHRAGACPRHGRAGGAVPPPVWRQRQGHLTASGSLCASAIPGGATPESGGLFLCPQMATDGGGPADPDIQEAQHPYRARASNGTEVTPTSPAVKGSSAVATAGRVQRLSLTSPAITSQVKD